MCPAPGTPTAQSSAFLRPAGMRGHAPLPLPHARPVLQPLARIENDRVAQPETQEDLGAPPVAVTGLLGDLLDDAAVGSRHSPALTAAHLNVRIVSSFGNHSPYAA